MSNDTKEALVKTTALTSDDYNPPIRLRSLGWYESSVDARLETKVDVEEGKGLSSNDFTKEYKDKLDSLSQSSGSIQSALENKVDKVNGKELISTTDIAQITTNKTNIQNLTNSLGNKVDKVSGKELISTTDIAQITQNKNDIAEIKAQLGNLAQVLEDTI